MSYGIQRNLPRSFVAFKSLQSEIMNPLRVEGTEVSMVHLTLLFVQWGDVGIIASNFRKQF